MAREMVRVQLWWLPTLVVLLGACAQEAGSAGPNADEPVAGGLAPPVDPGAPTARASVVVPVPGLVDVRATPWSEVEPGDQGQQLLLSFWGTPCTELDRVEVESGPERVVVTVHEGVRAADRGKPCVQVAEYKAVVVDLSEPLDGREVVDGA